MNRVVAYQLLLAELSAYRELPFRELREFVGERSSRRMRGPDGVDYELTVVTRWRLEADGDIRVIGFIGAANWGGPHDSVDETFVVTGPGPEG
jgi:hypothetical protein